MKRTTYINMIDHIRERPLLTKAITYSNSLITKAIYLAYPCLLIALILQPGAYETLISAPLSSSFLQALLVPFVSFVLLSLFRRAINAPRPYEVFDHPSLISKDTHGKSFPSRHVFSIFIIGTTFLFSCPIPGPGIVILCLGILLAGLRVVSGIHFPRDVIVGALIGIGAAMLGFGILN